MRLNVVITSPFVWPWVRRGTERIVHDLSRYLADRGHRVTVFATGPSDRAEDRDGVTYHLLRQRFGTRLRQFNCCHAFAGRLQHAMRDVDPDVVFSMNYFDAYAAIKARQRTGARHKIVFHSAGILTRRHFRAVPIDAWLFHVVRRHADLTVVVSEVAREVYSRNFGSDPLVLPPPVVIENFSSGTNDASEVSSSEPCIVFVGDADDRRKGARALCRAFPLVREHFPGAQLRFAGRASEHTRRSMLREAARLGSVEGISFLGLGSVQDLPALYRRASVTVLPAVAEAFGMALVESLAAGTPVVGARDGGMREIIASDLVGRLFDPGASRRHTGNVSGLAQAILEVLRRGKPPEVVAACKTHASKYSWAALGPEYERLLLRLAAAARGAEYAGQTRGRP